MSRIFLLLFLVLLVASFPLISNRLSKNGVASQINKDSINSIIEDYISSNPEKILESLNNMRINNTNKVNQELVKNHASELMDANYPSAGNPDSKITIVEFFDYYCGYCKKISDDIKKLISENKILYIFRDLPVLANTNSDELARNALAVHFINPKKYVELFYILLSHSEIINRDVFVEIIKNLGLTEEEFNKSLEKHGDDIVKLLDNTKKLAQDLRITGTPTFVLGGKHLLIGADLDSLHSILNELIAEQEKS